MFNVAVVNVKDILKYLVSITITLCLVMFATRYFSSLNEKNKLPIKEKILEIMQTNLLVCLDETIPAIKETNHELNNSEEDQINENEILGNLLKIELAMFEEKQKIADTQNSANNQVEKAETNIQDLQSQENQNTEISRKHCYTSCNAKSIIRQL